MTVDTTSTLSATDLYLLVPVGAVIIGVVAAILVMMRKGRSDGLKDVYNDEGGDQGKGSSDTGSGSGGGSDYDDGFFD